MKLSAVIGANYGDEGKGLITDFLSNNNTVVVRFNGGPQAGHTVVTPDYERHVFSHFGAGTLRGAATYLTKDFLINPIFYTKELKALQEIRSDLLPTLYIDPRALLITPFDMLLNQLVEKKRGNVRHGSCGMGIYETVLRSKTMPIHYRNNPEFVKNRLLELRETYFKTRAEELGITDIPDFVWNPLVIDNYVSMLSAMQNHAMTVAPEHIRVVFTASRDIVFEGAQGLALDQYNVGGMPHLTPSTTGLPNIQTFLNEAQLMERLDVYYVTRSYLTRHGAGPLPGELSGVDLEDATNITNEYQGHLRYAPLELKYLCARINWDLDRTRVKNIRVHLAMTHMDKVRDSALFPDFHAIKSSDYRTSVRELTGIRSFLYSTGPTRDHITCIKQAVAEDANLSGIS